jgi:hypothetical protein
MAVMYLGIDGGLQGGIVTLNENCEVVRTFVMPIIKGDKTEFDIVEINRIFDTIIRDNKDSKDGIIIGLEKAHTRPVQGIRAAFTTGYCLGMFEGILTSRDLGYEIINPSVWMREVFKGINSDDKKVSVMFCQRKWPGTNWRATERSKVIHNGLTDACCISYYMYLKIHGVNNEI